MSFRTVRLSAVEIKVRNPFLRFLNRKAHFGMTTTTNYETKNLRYEP